MRHSLRPLEETPEAKARAFRALNIEQTLELECGDPEHEARGGGAKDVPVRMDWNGLGSPGCLHI